MAEADNKVDSLNLHHLQDVRRRLDQLHELAVRHVDRLGRIERDLNEVKSDIILLENRSITATADIVALKETSDDSRERLIRIEEKLDRLIDAIGTENN